MLGKRKIDQDIQINLMTKSLLEKRLRMVVGSTVFNNNECEMGDETIERDLL
jgi:hypothetical protein